MKNLHRYLIQGLLITAITIVLLEAGLFALSLALKPDTNNNSDWSDKESLKVIALGDSNVYGLYLEADQAWPKVLEKKWNTTQHPKIEVINLGYPGTSSSMIRHNIENIIKAFKPDMLLIMVGVNDFWHSPVIIEENPVINFIKKHSRIYKFYRILRYSNNSDTASFEIERADIGVDVTGLNDEEFKKLHQSQLERAESSGKKMEFNGIEFTVGSNHNTEKATDRLDTGARFNKNINEIFSIASENKIQMILVGYSGLKDFYWDANVMMRRTAKKAGIPLVNSQAWFNKNCPDKRCKEYNFYDQHPNEAGHEVLSDLVLEHLKKQNP